MDFCMVSFKCTLQFMIATYLLLYCGLYICIYTLAFSYQSQLLQLVLQQLRVFLACSKAILIAFHKLLHHYFKGQSHPQKQCMHLVPGSKCNQRIKNEIIIQSNDQGQDEQTIKRSRHKSAVESYFRLCTLAMQRFVVIIHISNISYRHIWLNACLLCLQLATKS